MSTLRELAIDREHWSYSSLNQFLNICSLQWAFQRLYRIKPEFVPVNLSFGSAFHRTLEAISMQRLEGKLMKEKETADLFADLWSRQQQEDQNIRFDEDDDADKLSEQGRGLIACYRNNIDAEEEVVAINQAFCVPLQDAAGQVLLKPLIGEIDLVARKGGKKSIVDWKTSATRWNPGKCHRAMQPTMYLYGYEMNNGKGPLPEFRYDIVVKNKTPVFEQHRTKRGLDAFCRMVEKVKLAEAMVASEHFVPNDEGMFCKSCPFQGACKTWHRDRNRLISVASKAA
jgi:hypothetical protein